MHRSRSQYQPQSYSQAQDQDETPHPVMDERRLQNIWTMRPLGGTGGALKALAKNVAQHMNLNRSTLKRVVAQVVAEHHNLGQVDDYKGHMYYAKPERLNFLNLIAQSKEALDDLLLLDPHLARKFQHKEQLKQLLKASKLPQVRSKTRKVGAPSAPKKGPAPPVVRGSSTAMPVRSQVPALAKTRSVKKLARKPDNGQPRRTQPARSRQAENDIDLRSESRSRSALRVRSGSLAKSPKKSQRLPAGAARKLAATQKKPPAQTPRAAKLAPAKSKSKVKVTKSPSQSKPKLMPGKLSKSTKQGQVEQDRARSVSPTRSRVRSPSSFCSHSPSPSPTASQSPSPSVMPSRSSVTAPTVRLRRPPKEQKEALTSKVLTKALVKAFPQARSKSGPREKPRPPRQPFRNYDKPWLVPSTKRRRLAAGSHPLAKKKTLTKLSQIQVESRRSKDKQPSKLEVRKARSFVSGQMRKVNCPWYTPYQFQGAAGATQIPSGRNSTSPIMTSRFGPRLTCRQRHHRLLEERLKRDLRREGAIDTMLEYGSGMFRRHHGEWQPAGKTSSQMIQKERQKSRGSSAQHLPRDPKPAKSEKPPKSQKPPKPPKSQKPAKAEKSPKPEKPPIPEKRVKPSAGKGPAAKVGAQLPPPPPSAVSSDATPAPRPRASALIRGEAQGKVVDSSLGSYADLFQPADSKEIQTRAKRRLSIAFMRKTSPRRRRRNNMVWK